MFGVTEGKLLGHVISKKGISIDPEIIEAIAQIPLRHNKKGMQLFMGTINFVQRFVHDFAQIVKPLQQMVKQSVQFKWTDIEKGAFNNIKAAIAHAPSLKSPDFEKDFILYTFSSNNSLTTVLTQKEERGDEYPVSFMRTGLQSVEFNYPAIDKQAYAVFKEVNNSGLTFLKIEPK